MYKLTIIAGPSRGTSYAMQEGETSIGRQSGNSVVLQSAKISKRHCVLVVSNGEIIVNDQGSSNGTFVNGALSKSKKVKVGDRISVGEYVFEIAVPVQRPNARLPMSVPALPPVGGNVVPFPGTSAAISPPSAPLDFKGKVIWMFENKVMPFFYGLNLKHEWNILIIIMVTAFAGLNLLLSVSPLLDSNRSSLIQEISRRARFMARQIAERNAPYMAAKMETKSEIGSIENGEGVRLAVLTDLDSRIIAPGAKLNQYLTSGPEANFAVKARNRFRAGRETGLVEEVGSNLIVAAEPVRILSAQAGKNVNVGMAIVSVDSSLSTPDIGETGLVYAETLILTALLAGGIFFVLYKMTLRPFEVLSDDMDRVLKGDLPQVTHEYKLSELNGLWDLINSTLQRVPRNQSSMGGGGAVPEMTSEDFAGPLRVFGKMSKLGLVILDGDRKIIYMNPFFEEMSGVRAEGAISQEFSSVARDQSMGAFAGDLMDRAPVGGEGVSEDYDFSGITYKVHVAAFGNTGSTAKCYVLAATKAEEA